MRQDQGQRRRGGHHRQLGQRPDACWSRPPEAGFEGKFYTFYGNALGAPAAIGDAGIGKVIAVADWLPNVQTRPARPSTSRSARAFRGRLTTMCTCACS
jgi:hypothetical protein